jgi:hypothetical protein
MTRANINAGAIISAAFASLEKRIDAEINGCVGVDHGGPDEVAVYIIPPANCEYRDAPIFTEKPWLKFRDHPKKPTEA